MAASLTSGSIMVLSFSSPKILLAFSLLSLAFLGGCATSSPSPAKEKPIVKRVGVLPVYPPAALVTENRSAGASILYPGWLESLDNRVKSARFEEKMGKERLLLGDEMTQMLLQELGRNGFEAELLNGVPRPAGDPDSVAYADIPTSSPILHVWFDTVGLYSGRSSMNYIPRVNVVVNLVDKTLDDYLYSETIYYGADSRGEDYWSIPSDPAHKFPSFDALYGQPAAVADSLRTGLRAVARHAAKELRKQFP